MDKEVEERVGFVEFSKFHFIISGGFLNEAARSPATTRVHPN